MRPFTFGAATAPGYGDLLEKIEILRSTLRWATRLEREEIQRLLGQCNALREEVMSLSRRERFTQSSAAPEDPENLVESELFGHVKGAFTGAASDRKGKFESAHHGTIFLDEIGELPLSGQVKLLRVLQSQEIQRVGSDRSLQIDARIVAATRPER